MTMSDPIARYAYKNPQREHCKTRHCRCSGVKNENCYRLISWLTKDILQSMI